MKIAINTKRNILRNIRNNWSLSHFSMRTTNLLAHCLYIDGAILIWKGCQAKHGKFGPKLSWRRGEFKPKQPSLGKVMDISRIFNMFLCIEQIFSLNPFSSEKNSFVRNSIVPSWCFFLLTATLCQSLLWKGYTEQPSLCWTNNRGIRVVGSNQ